MWSPHIEDMIISFMELPLYKGIKSTMTGAQTHTTKLFSKRLSPNNDNESQDEMPEKVNSAFYKRTASLTFREHLADITGENTNAPAQTALCSPK